MKAIFCFYEQWLLGQQGKKWENSDFTLFSSARITTYRQKEIKYHDYRASPHGFYVNVNKYHDYIAFKKHYYGALSRYFLTKRQEETAIKKDRLEGEKKRRAAYERKKEKAKRRLSALEKMELSVTKKAKIMEVMKPAYMSSDEENGQDGFITHQPSWQSSKFQDYKSKLDNAYKNVCSKASLRLLQKRTIGNQSQKDVPQLAEHCQWIVRDLEPQNIGNQ
ncbi:unnamed protein product [Mytilus coruscus]|uniref:Uncharacterized protein n=1 Tax=Mytilus coruscus TaxID=42192 RepID=A0A6J8EBW3_MYTCO|nr:unnamed protein product [Mytilus coruscus]